MFPMNWIMQSFTLTDFWRWWVVHLWVEASFEFFAIVVSAYLLVVLGLFSRKAAEPATLFELILVFLGGIIGTGHHMYWIGEPGIWIGFGSMFSFNEILPLLLLVIESVQNWRHMHKAENFEHRTAVLYIVGSGLWNFLGASALGVLTTQQFSGNGCDYLVTYSSSSGYSLMRGTSCKRFAFCTPERDKQTGQQTWTCNLLGWLQKRYEIDTERI